MTEKKFDVNIVINDNYTEMEKHTFSNFDKMWDFVILQEKENIVERMFHNVTKIDKWDLSGKIVYYTVYIFIKRD